MLKTNHKIIWTVSWLALIGLFISSIQYYRVLNDFENTITRIVYVGNNKNSIFPVFENPGTNSDNQITTYFNPGTAADIFEFYKDDQNIFWVFVEAESGSGWTTADNISFEK